MIKKVLIITLAIGLFFGCKEDPKKIILEIDEKQQKKVKNEDVVDSTYFENIIAQKSIKQIKEDLDAKGYKTFYDIDYKKKDTFLMQQYFIAFLKKGPIRTQNEEEVELIQKGHLEHLTKMYELGYADISGPLGDKSDISGITIYNVPTLKIADSLANADPAVKAGRLVIEMHPWWAAKGFELR